MNSTSTRKLALIKEALNNIGQFSLLTSEEVNRVIYVYAFNHYGDGWADLKDIVQFLEPQVEDAESYATDGFEAGSPEQDAYDYLVFRGDLFIA